MKHLVGFVSATVGGWAAFGGVMLAIRFSKDSQETDFHNMIMMWTLAAVIDALDEKQP